MCLQFENTFVIFIVERHKKSPAYPTGLTNRQKESTLPLARQRKNSTTHIITSYIYEVNKVGVNDVFSFLLEKERVFLCLKLSRQVSNSSDRLCEKH